LDITGVSLIGCICGFAAKERKKERKENVAKNCSIMRMIGSGTSHMGLGEVY